MDPRHASGFGVERPRTHAAFRGIKAEGGWGGVCAITCTLKELQRTAMS